MKKVIFDLIKENGVIKYPDDISLFGKSEIIEDKIVAEYFGSLELEIYLEDIRNEKLKALKKTADKQLEVYYSQYPKIEVETFTLRGNEAIAWVNDNTQPTPNIDLTLANGYTAQDRITEIEAVAIKAALQRKEAGKFRDLRNAIENATTVEELDLITF